MIAMTATAPINIQVTDRSTSQANIIFSPPTNIVSQIYRYLIFLSSGGLPIHEDEIIAGGDGNIEGSCVGLHLQQFGPQHGIRVQSCRRELQGSRRLFRTSGFYNPNYRCVFSVVFC
uniref:Uncharacterized protein n=1 Tax=Ciona savignyi TaxID=51511 RepID=H2ZFS6_CIOSA